ncbi:MAG: outer membrane lipoprotein-sorting protein, partial [Thermogutta sp.]
VAKDMDVPLRLHYFDPKGQHIKTYEVQTIEKIKGIWTETALVMHHLIDDHRTVIRIVSMAYDTGLDDSAFSVRALETW